MNEEMVSLTGRTPQGVRHLKQVTNYPTWLLFGNRYVYCENGEGRHSSASEFVPANICLPETDFSLTILQSHINLATLADVVVQDSLNCHFRFV